MSITAKELKFLMNFREELSSQDGLGTAKPLIFQISYNKKIFGIFPNNSCDGELLISPYGNILESKEEIINEISRCCEEPFLLMRDSELSDLEYCKELLEELTGKEYKHCYYILENVLEGCFLTRKAAVNHLMQNRHHYPKDAKIYISHAFENPELENLLKIIKKL